jgi:hypothetical protein
MKRTVCVCLAFLLTLIFNFENYSSLAYSKTPETPIIPVEKDAETYEAKIVDMPPADDPRWVLVPKEEMANHLQLLVDRQNSNYERIRSWSGSYYQIRKKRMSQDIPDSGQSAPAYVLYEDLFTFACDVAEDKSFLRLERLYEQYYDKRWAETEPENVRVESDVCGVLTKDKYLQYDFRSDQIRGELEGVMPGRIGKVCLSMPAEEQRDISRVGTLFDPRLFFIFDFDGDKVWNNVEKAFIPWLRGEGSKELQQRMLDRLSVWRGDFDGVVWYRVVSFEEDRTIRDEYVFNSASNFNMVLSAQCDYGVPFMKFVARFTPVNDVYIPEEYLLIYRKEKSFRYFKLIDSVINEKISDDQFTLKAMGLDNDVVVLDDSTSTSYKYDNGRLKPIAKYGATETSRLGSFWSSPLRIASAVLGLALISYAVARRFRRRAANQSKEN